MRLEIGNYLVEQVEFGEKTTLENKLLTINKEELTSLLKEDGNFADVKINIARPGESKRIINVIDVFQPRCKPDGGSAYAALTGDISTTGVGRTNAVQNVGIVLSHHFDMLWESVIQMDGEGSQYSPYSKLINVSIEFVPADVPVKDYSDSVMAAGVKASEYIAEITKEMEADSIDVYEKSPQEKIDPSLPRVAYFMQIYSLSDLCENFLYGTRPRRILPMYIHPNDILDGSVTSEQHGMPSGMRNECYMFQNHPMIKELYKQHGKTLNFVGMVMINQYNEFEMKNKNAQIAARLAKYQLEADGVIQTQCGGGHPNVDLMLNTEHCDALGIKHVIMVSEESDVEGTQAPLVLFSPKAKSIVSTGNTNQWHHFDGVETVYGGEHFRNVPQEVHEPVELSLMMVSGATSQIGGNYIKAVEI